MFVIIGRCNSTEKCFQIPLQYTRQEMVKLVIAFVLQEIKDDQVHWYLHRFKGFLPRAAETDSPPVNPICIDINRADLMPDGIFKYDSHARNVLDMDFFCIGCP